MPSPRITTSSPWHVVLIAQRLSAETAAASRVREALEAFVTEMTFLSQGGQKPYFRVTLIENVSPHGVRATVARDVDVDALLQSEAGMAVSEVTSLERALADAYDVLANHPGSVSDFTPYIFILAAEGEASPEALAMAKDIKELVLAAGRPQIVVCDFADTPLRSLAALASRAEFTVRLKDPLAITQVIPVVGTMSAASTGHDEVHGLIARLLQRGEHDVI